MSPLTSERGTRDRRPYSLDGMTDCIRLWCFNVDSLPDSIAAGGRGSTCSDDEIRRCERLLDALDRRRCLARRLVLRRVLGDVLDMDPAGLEFAAGESGKPVLSGRCANAGIEFNVSHSDNLLLVGVSNGGPIGVDIEVCRDGLDVMDIAETHFSRAEVRRLRQVPRCRCVEAFYRLWTRREALAKADGRGVAAIQGRPSSELEAYWRVHPLQARAGTRPAVGAVAFGHDALTLELPRLLVV